ncbi:MAG TPA: hypothetical protein VEA37_08620 [Flavobacterium sp.]|nr:hypothetical protein [Flavobacterium sp.]
MKTIKVKHVPCIETALKQYLNEGYLLDSIAKTSDEELRFYLHHPDKDEEVCLVRQFLRELIPGGVLVFEDRIEKVEEYQPIDYTEFHTESEKEYLSTYYRLNSLGLIEAIPDDDICQAAVLNLVNSNDVVVNPHGYTWE